MITSAKYIQYPAFREQLLFLNEARLLAIETEQEAIRVKSEALLDRNEAASCETMQAASAAEIETIEADYRERFLNLCQVHSFPLIDHLVKILDTTNRAVYHDESGDLGVVNRILKQATIQKEGEKLTCDLHVSLEGATLAEVMEMLRRYHVSFNSWSGFSTNEWQSIRDEAQHILAEEIQVHPENGNYVHQGIAISKQEAILRAVARLEARIEKLQDSIVTLEAFMHETTIALAPPLVIVSERFVKDILVSLQHSLANRWQAITFGRSSAEFDCFVVGLACAQAGILLEHLSMEDRQAVVDVFTRAKGLRKEEELTEEGDDE